MAEIIRLLVTTEAEDVFEILVSGDLDVETLEALCEIETGMINDCCKSANGNTIVNSWFCSFFCFIVSVLHDIIIFHLILLFAILFVLASFTILFPSTLRNSHKPLLVLATLFTNSIY